MAPIPFLALFTAVVTCVALPSTPSIDRSFIKVPSNPPADVGVPLQPFVSYSIEFSSFPDFAGNLSHPNTFSNNLLDNLASYSGIKPLIRVGGNTQDFAVFDESLNSAIVGIVDPAKSPDYPTTITIGPAYFESYLTWPDVKFIHGLNLGKNSTVARQGLLVSVPFACKALGGGRLAYWELGNEPDLFKRSSVRSPNWNEQDYALEWLTWTRRIREAVQDSCPELAANGSYQYYAPSFAGTGGNGLDPVLAWEAGLDADKDIALISSHNYISGAMVPGVTLQGTLMNHSSTVQSIAKQLNSSRYLAALSDDLQPDLPFILGETNSLYNQGRPGLSNTFGATLWGVDFNLWCVANEIRRVHMHQGTNYRYQSWQPIDTNITSKGTKAPYYGNIAIAAFLGDLSSKEKLPHVINLPLPSEKEAAYASYVQGRLSKLVVINMDEYNATAGNEFINDYERPMERYNFQLPHGCEGHYHMQRLSANGSDAITGVTFDGYSYNYELNNGMPIQQNNVTNGEKVYVKSGGHLHLEVPRSSAAIIVFCD
jgi:hypothetical protein